MKRFMIGQYGAFDERKYRRDFLAGFHGIEACLFQHEQDTVNLVRESEREGFRIGIHFPLRAGMTAGRDALFLAQDDRTRDEAFSIIRRELDFLTAVKPDYILFHYPKPVILDDRVDWSKWRFADRSEYVFESEYSLQEFRERSERLFEWLSDQGREYRFTPVLELDALNRYVYEGDFLERMLDTYRSVKLCLDTGRLYMQERLDPYFDAKSVLKKYAKYAETVHLWNVRITPDLRIENNHYPALPELRPQDGWAPIQQYLRIIRDDNETVKIVFEHRSDLISDEELMKCYEWVDRIFRANWS